MTAAQVAEAAGITPAHVSKLERGKGSPSVAVLVKIANVLNVSLEELVSPEAD